LRPAATSRLTAPGAGGLPAASIFYAMKANPEPAVLQVLEAAGANFEVASLGEYRELINTCDALSPDRMIFGTSVKPKGTIRALVAAGVDRLAADSEEELRKIHDAAPGARVILRVVADAHQTVFSMSEKFGAQREDAARLLRLAADMGLVPHGLSFNVGSQATEAQAWGHVIAGLAPVLRTAAGGHSARCAEHRRRLPAPVPR
jgi:ornithine decarboxylase